MKVEALGKAYEVANTLAEVFSKVDDGIKAIAEALGERIGKIPVEHMQAFGSSHAKFSVFIFNSAELICLTHSAWKRPKERIMRVYNVALKGASIAGDVAEFGVALGELKLVAAKVASVAATVGIGIGFVTTAGAIINDSVRLGQSIKELKNIQAVKLEEGGRISFKALYGVSRKELHEAHEKVEKKEKVVEHMKSRLKIGITFRSIEIVAGLVSLVALTVLLVAGGPIGWGLMAAATAIALTTLVTKLIVNYKMNQKLEALKNEAAEKAAEREKMEAILGPEPAIGLEQPPKSAADWIKEAETEPAYGMERPPNLNAGPPVAAASA